MMRGHRRRAAELEAQVEVPGKSRSLLQRLAAIQDPDPADPTPDSRDLIAMGYVLPVEGRLRLTILGLETLRRLRAQEVA